MLGLSSMHMHWAQVGRALGAWPRIPGTAADPAEWRVATDVTTSTALVSVVGGVTLVARAYFEDTGPIPGSEFGRDSRGGFWYPELTGHLPVPLELGLQVNGYGWSGHPEETAREVLAFRDAGGYSFFDHARALFTGDPARVELSATDVHLRCVRRPTLGSWLATGHSLSYDWLRRTGLRFVAMAHLLEAARRQLGPPRSFDQARDEWRAFAADRSLVFTEPMRATGQLDDLRLQIWVSGAGRLRTNVTLDVGEGPRFGVDSDDPLEVGGDLTPVLDRLLGPTKAPRPRWIQPPATLTALEKARSLRVTTREIRFEESGIADATRLDEIVGALHEIADAIRGGRNPAAGPYR